MATKTPNLNKTRAAWTRWQGLWFTTLPITLGNLLGNTDKIKELRKR